MILKLLAILKQKFKIAKRTVCFSKGNTEVCLIETHIGQRDSSVISEVRARKPHKTPDELPGNINHYEILADRDSSPEKIDSSDSSKNTRTTIREVTTYDYDDSAPEKSFGYLFKNTLINHFSPKFKSNPHKNCLSFRVDNNTIYQEEIIAPEDIDLSSTFTERAFLSQNPSYFKTIKDNPGFIKTINGVHTFTTTDYTDKQINFAFKLGEVNDLMLETISNQIQKIITPIEKHVTINVKLYEQQDRSFYVVIEVLPNGKGVGQEYLQDMQIQKTPVKKAIAYYESIIEKNTPPSTLSRKRSSSTFMRERKSSISTTTNTEPITLLIGDHYVSMVRPPSHLPPTRFQVAQLHADSNSDFLKREVLEKESNAIPINPDASSETSGFLYPNLYPAGSGLPESMLEFSDSRNPGSTIENPFSTHSQLYTKDNVHIKLSPKTIDALKKEVPENADKFIEWFEKIGTHLIVTDCNLYTFPWEINWETYINGQQKACQYMEALWKVCPDDLKPGFSILAGMNFGVEGNASKDRSHQHTRFHSKPLTKTPIYSKADHENHFLFENDHFVCFMSPTPRIDGEICIQAKSGKKIYRLSELNPEEKRSFIEAHNKLFSQFSDVTIDGVKSRFESFNLTYEQSILGEDQPLCAKINIRSISRPTEETLKTDTKGRPKTNRIILLDKVIAFQSKGIYPLLYHPTEMAQFIRDSSDFS